MPDSISDSQINELLSKVLDIYGYDFTNYAKASLKRRIVRLIGMDKLAGYAELEQKIATDAVYFNRFVEELTVNVTEMFRDPSFFRELRAEVLPMLATYPYIRIWHAGCSTGEEVYSLAIMLHEMGLLKKCLIYATDLNPEVLEAARQGIYKIGPMQQCSEKYIAAGGTGEFSSYYTANYDYVKLNEQLSSKMIFSTHNLVSDRSFNEFQLIVCRNVLIYFDRHLQDKVFQLFDNSLEKLCFSGAGQQRIYSFFTYH